MKSIARMLSLLVVATLPLVSEGDIPDPERIFVGASYGRQVLVPRNQLLNPAGHRVEMPGRRMELALRAQGDLLSLRFSNEVRFFPVSGQLIRSGPLGTASFMGLAFTPDGEWVVSPQNRPFTALPIRIPLTFSNPSLATLIGKERKESQQSLAMNFSRPVAAPEELLNPICGML